MKTPTKYQIQDYLAILVCCCIKWEQPEGKANIYIDWDDQKLHRLQTFLDLKKASRESLEIIKHDISFTNHWNIKKIINDCCIHLHDEFKEHCFLASLIIIGKNSSDESIQFKKDFDVLSIIREGLSLSPDSEKRIFTLGHSLTSFSEAIDKQYNFDLPK